MAAAEIADIDHDGLLAVAAEHELLHSLGAVGAERLQADDDVEMLVDVHVQRGPVGHGLAQGRPFVRSRGELEDHEVFLMLADLIRPQGPAVQLNPCSEDLFGWHLGEVLEEVRVDLRFRQNLFQAWDPGEVGFLHSERSRLEGLLAGVADDLDAAVQRGILLGGSVAKQEGQVHTFQLPCPLGPSCFPQSR